MAKTKEYYCLTVNDTQRIGCLLGQHAFSGALFLCGGDLGAGKTCLAKGIAYGLNISEEITSPTFVLIKEYYDGRLPLYHMDLYRLDDQTSIFDLGLDDYIYGQGVSVIEWAEKATSGLFPSEYLYIQISLEKEGRRLKLEAHGALYEELLEEMP
ncbi:MAG: tRNA (adenosine(37)-N6)-threonylcarbamoyltransferase complex ATPase subunit type 1 TsaE [Chloroflexi bacterium]|nr:tRNA (adenosine(37)-N6)-threonylcarbamoyltransferase complex ATPase subunit type 1 TsaE [Chloroflexota bacterium]